MGDAPFWNLPLNVAGQGGPFVVHRDHGAPDEVEIRALPDALNRLEQITRSVEREVGTTESELGMRPWQPWH
jgi:hypothetical protein